jgi:hypothetical protein
MTAAELDTQVGWKCPAAVKGACSAADITQLDTNFKDAGLQSWFDLGNNLSASCKACAFAKDTDANWGAIVGTAADNGQTGFINFGACYGHVEGDKCGRSLQYEQFCYNIVCNECAATSAERAKCVQFAGSQGSCKGFGDDTAKNCPQLTNTSKTCNTVFDAVKHLCGT